MKQIDIKFNRHISEEELHLISIYESSFQDYLEWLISNNLRPSGGVFLFDNSMEKKNTPISESWIAENEVCLDLFLFIISGYRKSPFLKRGRRVYHFSNIDHCEIELNINESEILIINSCVEENKGATFEFTLPELLKLAEPLIERYILMSQFIPLTYKYYQSFNFNYALEIHDFIKENK
jgi:hypothetical protein